MGEEKSAANPGQSEGQQINSGVRSGVPYEELCQQILSVDGGVRFAGVADYRGNILATKYRKEIEKSPLLTEDELRLSVSQSVIRMGTRKSLEGSLGKPLYSITTYEKVKRATIPIVCDGHDYMLMISLDLASRPGPLINKKIIPLVKSLWPP
ncbi:MAG TPA: hypothetical protein VF172_02330 [Nitrososphaera sp.]|jgi:hypothetical protein